MRRVQGVGGGVVEEGEGLEEEGEFGALADFDAEADAFALGPGLVNEGNPGGGEVVFGPGGPGFFGLDGGGVEGVEHAAGGEDEEGLAEAGVVEVEGGVDFGLEEACDEVQGGADFLAEWGFGDGG